MKRLTCLCLTLSLLLLGGCSDDPTLPAADAGASAPGPDAGATSPGADAFAAAPDAAGPGLDATTAIELPDAAAPGGPDAATEGPDATSPGPDAGPALPPPGETCATAPELATASMDLTNDPKYAHQARGHFGASNDYNPNESASPVLPPNCSMVYDARGKEVVYAVTLDPGQTLKMRLTPSSTGVRTAIYVLDGCTPLVTWPDYDASGHCGDNEFTVAEGIGASYWYPVEWTWTYPINFTGSRTFYFVLDQLEGDNAGYFSFDWVVVP